MKRATRGLILLALTVVAGACHDDPVGPSVAHVEHTLELITPASVVLESLGEQIEVRAQIMDGKGYPTGDLPIEYRTEAGGVLTDLGAGRFESSTAGRAWVHVGVPVEHLEGLTPEQRAALTAVVEVNVEPRPVALAIGTPAPIASEDTVVRLWALGQETILPVWTADANGNRIERVEAGLTWNTDDESVTQVDYAGRLEAMTDGTTTVRVEGHGMTGTVAVVVNASLELSSCVEMASAGSTQCGTRALTFRHGKPNEGS